jgi:hypothetical protein
MSTISSQLDAVDLSKQEFADWSPKRRQLLNWFRGNAVALAEAYEGAVRLIEDSSFPGRVHFIGHAVRDIADRLAFTLDAELSGSRVQYENELDKIEKTWKRLVRFEEDQHATKEDSVEIGYHTACQIEDLINAHRDRRSRPSNAEMLFRCLMRLHPTTAEINSRLVDDFKKIRAWFMAFTHLRQDKAPEVNELTLQAKFNAFESMLHSFVGEFFTGTAEIDDILQQANS